jgi:hypothetical protein
MQTQSIHKPGIEIEEDSFRLVSLFMTWFLRKERVGQDLELNRWLEVLDEFEEEDLDRWSVFVRQAFMEAAQMALLALLERPLELPERLLMGAYVERFMEDHRKDHPAAAWEA